MEDFAKNMYARPTLPFNGFSDEDLNLIENVLRLAWCELKANQTAMKINLVESEEKDINLNLVRIVNTLRDSSTPLFVRYKKWFDRLSSSPEYYTCNGEKIKQPDMVFHLRNPENPGIDESFNAYFVEAKRLNNQNQGLKKYHDDGVRRFLEGSYAWAMPHGMMLGYCQNNFKLPIKLNEHLERGTNKEKYRVKLMPQQCLDSHFSKSVYITVHNRDWCYYDRPGDPGDIEIAHVWLDCN